MRVCRLNFSEYFAHLEETENQNTYADSVSGQRFTLAVQVPDSWNFYVLEGYMCVDKPSLVYDPDLDEVDKAEMWLGVLLRDYQDGNVTVKNQQHLF